MAIVLQSGKIERYLRDIVDHIILNEGEISTYIIARFGGSYNLIQ